MVDRISVAQSRLRVHRWLRQVTAAANDAQGIEDETISFYPVQMTEVTSEEYSE